MRTTRDRHLLLNTFSVQGFATEALDLEAISHSAPGAIIRVLPHSAHYIIRAFVVGICIEITFASVIALTSEMEVRLSI